MVVSHYPISPSLFFGAQPHQTRGRTNISIGWSWRIMFTSQRWFTMVRNSHKMIAPCDTNTKQQLVGFVDGINPQWCLRSWPATNQHQPTKQPGTKPWDPLWNSQVREFCVEAPTDPSEGQGRPRGPRHGDAWNICREIPVDQWFIGTRNMKWWFIWFKYQWFINGLSMVYLVLKSLFILLFLIRNKYQCMRSRHFSCIFFLFVDAATWVIIGTHGENGWE